MSVYVDEPRYYDSTMIRGALTRRYGNHWSHMWADSEAELLAFARRVDMPLRWLQHEGTRRVHFDVTPARRQKAIRAGAVQLEYREWRKREAAGSPAPE
jgi:hypothetical protein